MSKLSVGAGLALALAMPLLAGFPGGPAATTTTITISPAASVAQGDTASAIGQTTSGGTAVSIGKLELQTAADADGNPTSCALQTQFLSGAPVDVDSNGSATFPLNTSTLGTYGYRLHYTQGSTYGNGFSACADLTVTLPPCSGVTVAADLASGDGTPPAGTTQTWIVEIKVHACEAATNLKVQGGANAWATTSVGSPSVGSLSVRSTGKSNNIVITWNIESLAAGAEATLQLTITGTIKPNTPSGTVLGLTGPWSVVYSTDGGVTYQKSAYAGSVTATVQ